MNSQSEAVTEIIESVRPELIAPDPALVRGEALRRRRVRQTSWRVGVLAMIVLVGVGVFVARGPSSSEPVQTVDEPDLVEPEPNVAEPDVVDVEPDVAEPEPDDDDIEPEVDLSGPTFAPEAEFPFTGTWSPVVLRAEARTVDLTLIPDAEMTVRGRSFSSSDGCNGTGAASVLWEPDGRIELMRGSSTAVGCEFQEERGAFDVAIRDASSWGVTDDGQLVLVGPSTYVRFEQVATEALILIDRSWSLLGLVEGLAGQGDAELGEDDSEVLLTIDGSDGTLESVDCDAALTFTVEVGANRVEGFFRAVGIDPSGCDSESFAYRTASFLADSDYYLSTEEALVFWQGANMRVLLAPRRP